MAKNKINSAASSITIPLYIVIGLFFLALILRFWQITVDQFLFYDEGMYLGYNRNFLQLVAANPPRDISEFFTILGLMFKASLGTAKALWFFILNLRVFILGPESWYFARIISAVAGVATVVLVYFWSKRYFKSQQIALLSALILALLPSHIFYSRLGMQEALSTFLFFYAVYLYTHKRELSWRDVLAGLILSTVFFTNYRMIIAPFLFALVEGVLAFSNKEKINWQKWGVLAAVFYGLVFFIGNLYDGANRYVTFGWMFHQAQDATGKFDIINFLSYPYYTFALEGIFIGLLFWANARYLFLKKWALVLPFIIVLGQMAVFSLAAEKGARYLCVVLPFLAIAVAVSLDEFFKSFSHKKGLVYISLGLLLFTLLFRSFFLTLGHTDYQKAMQFVLAKDPNAMIVSTQPLVEDLYAPKEGRVKACPKDVASLVELYKAGARYLIIDPQAYISWTADNKRFTFDLIDFLELIRLKVEPMARFPHLEGVYLDRFVLDHNENLVQSLQFLSKKDHSRGEILVFDLSVCLAHLREVYK